MDKTQPTFSHVNIVAFDVAKMIEFFGTHFGMKAGTPTRTSDPWVSALTGLPDAEVEFTALSSQDQTTRIELLKFINPASPAPATNEAVPNVLGYRHVGFSVPNIWDRYEEMTREGYHFLSKPQTVAEMGVITVYFEGPEGILIQLTQDKKT
jgi:catechol 2,3-dioxygenase-like lactoylglutathione lyase family enzyme